MSEEELRTNGAVEENEGFDTDEDAVEGDEDDETVEDIALDTEARVDALVSLLVKKGIITEEEFEQAYDEQFEAE